MKQPSRKPCTRESLLDHISGDLDRIIEAVAGTAQDLNTDQAGAITSIANALSQQATQSSLQSRSRWLTDGTSVAAVVRVQLGKRKAFPDSEEISARIYSPDNIKVILTHNIVMLLKKSGDTTEQLTVFHDQDSAMRFLGSVYDRVIAADSNPGSNL